MTSATRFSARDGKMPRHKSTTAHAKAAKMRIGWPFLKRLSVETLPQLSRIVEEHWRAKGLGREPWASTPF
jgi:hypothetical protein